MAVSCQGAEAPPKTGAVDSRRAPLAWGRRPWIPAPPLPATPLAPPPQRRPPDTPRPVNGRGACGPSVISGAVVGAAVGEGRRDPVPAGAGRRASLLLVASVAMEESPLLGATAGPDPDVAIGLLSPEGPTPAPSAAVRPEQDDLPVLRDAYLFAADPGEPPGVDGLGEGQAPALGDFPGLPAPCAQEDAAQPPTYSLHVPSSLLPLGTEMRVTPVICQLKGGAQVLCIDNSGTRELKGLQLIPQCQDQNNYLQTDASKPLTTLVGRFLPVPAKLNLITQQLDTGTLPSAVSGLACSSGPTLPGPPKISLSGYCDCFAHGDFCNNCNCNKCCNNSRHEMERFKAIKACLNRNPEAFQPKIETGRLGDAKPRHTRGCHCRRSGCLKNYCECYEAKIMCSSMCKCIDCNNYKESPERKTLQQIPSYVETGEFEDSHHVSPRNLSGLPRFRKDRQPSSCISREVVGAVCACLLARAEEAEKECCSKSVAEQMILEEFGRCMAQILHVEFKSKGLKMEPSTI
ncbi:tesmin [Ctenodactylus gundi]